MRSDQLLIPGPRQSRVLRSTRAIAWLERARAFFERVTPERFEGDANGVVLGLSFGQAEAVDLNAVAEAQGAFRSSIP